MLSLVGGFVSACDCEAVDDGVDDDVTAART